jgi:hypothetical protein
MSMEILMASHQVGVNMGYITSVSVMAVGTTVKQWGEV